MSPFLHGKPTRAVTPKPPTRYIPPIIPFIHPVLPTWCQDKILTFKLCTEPENKHSMTYELTIPYFKNCTPEEYFLFLKAVEKVIVGQNMADASSCFALICRLLQGDALAHFNYIAEQQIEESETTLSTCWNALVVHILP